jgi:hypothetical protein
VLHLLTVRFWLKRRTNIWRLKVASLRTSIRRF